MARNRVAAISVASLATIALLAAADLPTTDAQEQPTAELACPSTGTVFTMSMPLAISAEPIFRNRVAVIGNDGLDCHLSSQANGIYWQHAGIVKRDAPKEVQIAAESIWPLKVGNTASAVFQYGGQRWTTRFKVASYEKFAARIGTYDAFKIVETVEVDGKLNSEAMRWWAPALRYTLSYRRMPDNYNFEVAAITP